MSTEQEDFNDKVHGFCLDCGRKMADKWMFNNPFAKSGQAPSCPSCGGVVAVMDERRAQHEIAKNQRSRGVGREARPTEGDWRETGEEPGVYMPEQPE